MIYLIVIDDFKCLVIIMNFIEQSREVVHIMFIYKCNKFNNYRLTSSTDFTNMSNYIWLSHIHIISLD